MKKFEEMQKIFKLDVRFVFEPFYQVVLSVAEEYDKVYPSATARRSRGVQFYEEGKVGDELFFVVFNLHASGDGEGNKTECHHQPKEVLIADVLRDEAGNHTWNHHTTKILTCGTDGENCCGAITSRESDEKESVSSKAKAITDLLNAYTSTCKPQVCSGEITKIDIHNIRQRDT